MAFETTKNYPNRKDNRRVYKPWEYAKSVSQSCRNHGGCKACVSNRRIHWLRELDKTQDMLDHDLD
jgi:hypothetical protein